MTFAVVIATPTSLWACADRQLGRELRPSGVKIAIVQAFDGTALLTYAGLGLINRTEVSLWITRTLNTLDWPLEALLQEVARASRKRLLIEAAKEKQDQSFIASAFHQGVHRIYTIDKDARITPSYLPRRGINWEPAGAGKTIFEAHFERRRIEISRQIKLCERGSVRPLFIAKKLAELNAAVSAKASKTDGISAECIVVGYTLSGEHLRFRHWVFDAQSRLQTQKLTLVPHVFRGQLVTEVGNALWAPLIERVENTDPGEDSLAVWKECIAELGADMPARLAKIPVKSNDDF
jgi:hypothetical protein